MRSSCFCFRSRSIAFFFTHAAKVEGTIGYWVVFLDDQIDWSACLVQHLFKHNSSLLESLLCVLYMGLIKLVTYGFVSVDPDIDCSLVK